MNETKLYKVNEIFLSIQAEGKNTGRAAVFVRLSGCNLKCQFCDTDHSEFREMSRCEIESEVESLDPSGDAIVVITGGEPAMQLTEERIVAETRLVAVETNGTIPVPSWVNWVTVSPKTKLRPEVIARANEVKVLFGLFDEQEMERIGNYCSMLGVCKFVQPMADKDGRFCASPCVEFVKSHPDWMLSLQWHKMIGVR